MRSNNKRHWRRPFGCVVGLAFAGAVGGVGSPPVAQSQPINAGTFPRSGFAPARIKSVVLARGYVNRRATGITTVFRPSDRTFHCVVKLERVALTSAQAIWRAVDIVGNDKNIKIREDRLSPGLVDTLHFSMSLRRNWPKGRYRVAIYLDYRLARTVDFSVQ